MLSPRPDVLWQAGPSTRLLSAPLLRQTRLFDGRPIEEALATSAAEIRSDLMWGSLALPIEQVLMNLQKLESEEDPDNIASIRGETRRLLELSTQQLEEVRRLAMIKLVSPPCRIPIPTPSHLSHPSHPSYPSHPDQPASCLVPIPDDGERQLQQRVPSSGRRVVHDADSDHHARHATFVPA